MKVVPWKDLKNCRTCRFADATDRDRIYRAKYVAHRCTFPMETLPWPDLPFSITHAYQVQGRLDSIKNGSAKRAISFGNPNVQTSVDGENCPTWEKWVKS